MAVGRVSANSKGSGGVCGLDSSLAARETVMLGGVTVRAFIVILFLCSVRHVRSANVLLVQADIVFPSSHFFISNSLIQELAARGHRLFVRLHSRWPYLIL